MPLIHILTQVINLFVARCPSYKKNKTKYAQSKMRSSFFIEKVGFLFLNEVYCLVFLFLCHRWFLLRQFVNLYISPVPPCWTLLLLVGNTDCVNLLHCSLWPLNIVANKLRQKYWLCFLEPLCRSSDTRPDFEMRFPGGNWILAIHRLFIYCCYFERQGKFSRRLSYSV